MFALSKKREGIHIHKGLKELHVLNCLKNYLKTALI